MQRENSQALDLRSPDGAGKGNSAEASRKIRCGDEFLAPANQKIEDNSRTVRRNEMTKIRTRAA
jgi:hypothetical protein